MKEERTKKLKKDNIEDVDSIYVNGFLRYSVWPYFKTLNKIKEHFTSIIDINDINVFWLGWMRPNLDVYPHSENLRPVNNRSIHTNIYIPVGPDINNFVPLEVYYDNKIYMLREKEQKKHKIYMLNSQLLHAVFNNNFHRITAQIRFDMKYQDVIKKYPELLDR